MRNKRKKGRGTLTIENSYKQEGIELVSFNFLYGDNRKNRLKVIKAHMDGDNQINKMFKQIFYPLKINNGRKKMNIINGKEY